MAPDDKHSSASAAASATATSPAARSAKSKSKLGIALVVLVVTIAECAAAYLYMPARDSSGSDAMEEPEAPPVKEPAHGKASSGKAAEHGKADHAKSADHGKPAEHAKPAEHGKHAPSSGQKAADDHREVDLGEFRVTAYQPLSNTTLRLDFHVFGTVKEGDEEEFTGLLEAKQQRFRDQVIVTIRSVEMTDFTEAGLGLIKRRILETTNKMLGKPFLQSVVFSEFSFIEQ